MFPVHVTCFEQTAIFYSTCSFEKSMHPTLRLHVFVLCVFSYYMAKHDIYFLVTFPVQLLRVNFIVLHQSKKLGILTNNIFQINSFH